MKPTTNKLVSLDAVREKIISLLLPREAHIVISLIETLPVFLEPMEYEIGKEYEFSDDGKEWHQAHYNGTWKYIRPITISPEVTSAISLLEATGEYKITKK